MSEDGGCELEYIGNILYDDQLYKELSIVIYGAGRVAKKIIGFLEINNCKENIKCLCDGNIELWNTKLDGINIMSPSEAVKRYEKALFIVGGDYANEMIRELIMLGVLRIHLLLVY